MTSDKKVIVNPATEDLLVEDDLGRRIKYKPGGNEIPWTPHIQRRIRFGELTVIQKKGAPKTASKKTEIEKEE